jgi:hypothetical protein
MEPNKKRIPDQMTGTQKHAQQCKLIEMRPKNSGAKFNRSANKLTQLSNQQKGADSRA